MTKFLALALLGGWPFGSHGQTETSRYVIPAWHVETVRDRFTQRRVCHVFQGNRHHPKVSYSRGTLAFAFPRSRNTLEAEFSVDGGPARPWTSVYPAVVATGATLPGTSMTNPTQGLVILPVSALKGAIRVTIRSRPNDKPRVFSIAGLADAIASGGRLGCDADNGFIRSV